MILRKRVQDDVGDTTGIYAVITRYGGSVSVAMLMLGFGLARLYGRIATEGSWMQWGGGLIRLLSRVDTCRKLVGRNIDFRVEMIEELSTKSMQ